MPEFVDIVDEDDNILKSVERSQLEAHHITRNVIVMVQDSDKNAILQLRSEKKRDYPNCYDTTACGAVRTGESYEEAAKRELLEETGLTCDLKHVKTLFRSVEDGTGTKRLFYSAFFHAVHDGEEFNPHPDEVSRIDKFPIQHILEKVKSDDKQFPEYLAEDIEFMKGYLL